MVTALEANVAAFLAVAVLGVGALLCAVSVLSWTRLRHPRLLLPAGAFAALAAKGAIGAAAASRGQPSDLVGGGLDFALVILLYGSIAQR